MLDVDLPVLKSTPERIKKVANTNNAISPKKAGGNAPHSCGLLINIGKPPKGN
jgi:hypothetical protein